MNLRKLPPSMVLALGLAGCGDEPTADSNTSGADSAESSGGTFMPPTATSTSGNPSTTRTTGVSTSACLDVGPCLFDIPPSETTDGFTTGPCLGPPLESSGSSAETGTDSGSSTGDTEGTTGTTGMMADGPPSRAAAVERVLDRGALPPDVAARLRRILGE